MTTTWAAAFGDGWNGSLINPMSRAEAAARDHAGDPYAVVLFGDGVVRAEIRVAWAETYAAVVRYDADGRRRSVHEFRPDDEGGLTPWTARSGDDGIPAAARGDGPGHASSPFPPRLERTPAPRLPRPAFGRWSELLDRAGAGPVEVTAAEVDELPTSHGDGLPWRPPRPLAPRDLADLFTDGAARPIDEGRITARIEVVPAGHLRMPSGRLVVADPGELGMGARPAPFVVTVDPGVYPVAVSRVHLPGADGHAHEAGARPRTAEGHTADAGVRPETADGVTRDTGVRPETAGGVTRDAGVRPQTADDHGRVAGVRVQIADRPVMSWQMALQPGQDPLDLGEGDYFGVEVDTGCACLADAESWGPLDETVDSYELIAGVAPATMVGDGAMLAFTTGWGDGRYPTWIGRDAAGEVVCFVTDMLL